MTERPMVPNPQPILSARRKRKGSGGTVYVWLMVLLSLLGGCATSTPTHVVTVITPPDSLLQDCAHAPRPADSTVNGLLLGIVNERNVVESCDWADKAALRAWKAGVQAAQGTP